jgi:hypothetical protein
MPYGLATILTVLLAAVLLISAPAAPAATVLVEAESFADAGGWVIDQQFMDEMGSPYLLAHGLGEPVKDAVTTVTFPSAGEYRVWVRTRDWVWMSKAPGTAGLFNLVVDGKPLAATFGTKGKDWHWQDGGVVAIDKDKVAVALHDLTGFEGRCDAVCFSSDAGFAPPDDPSALAAWRRKVLGLPDRPADGGQYDLVVVGGGIAGSAAAISAARLGVKVALIQDRPVLGGNNSSEVRVWLNGETNFEPYPRIGDIVRELDHKVRAHSGPDNKAEIYEDDRRIALVREEKNITLLLGWRGNAVELAGGRIAAVIAQEVATGKRLRFACKLMADCTGHGVIGALAKAEFQMTDKGHMGRSNLWNAADTGKPASFPRCPWAVDLSDKPFPGRPALHAAEKDNAVQGNLNRLGQWFWESGFYRDPIVEGEHIRDNNLRAMYGAWDALKNVDKIYPNYKLNWAAYIAGPRESRRIVGDVLLTKDDVMSNKQWPDACVPCTWSIDLHLPDKRYDKGFEGDEFISKAEFTRFKTPYWIPYRCLYSRNIENLFMAGRDISVTHEALGTVRVMRTCGMMGEVVGMAAAVCKDYNTTPRGVYTDFLSQLKAMMAKGVGKLPPVTHQPAKAAKPGAAAAASPVRLTPPEWLSAAGTNVARAAVVSVSGSYAGGKYPAANINNGKIDVTTNAGRWVSDGKLPATVTFTWDAPRTIAAARIVSGWNHGATVGNPNTDFAFQTPDGEGWKDVPGAGAAGNDKIDWSARFAPVTASRLRLVISAAPGDLARIYEVELYDGKQ